MSKVNSNGIWYQPFYLILSFNDSNKQKHLLLILFSSISSNQHQHHHRCRLLFPHPLPFWYWYDKWTTTNECFSSLTYKYDIEDNDDCWYIIFNNIWRLQFTRSIKHLRNLHKSISKKIPRAQKIIEEFYFKR